MKDVWCNWRAEATPVGGVWRVTESGTQTLVVGTSQSAGDFRLDLTVWPAARLGTCLAPKLVTLPYVEAFNASTANWLSASLGCETATNLPAVAYQFTLAHAANVTVAGTDVSGGGIGASLRSNSCTGTSLGCQWASGGNLHETYNLPSGTYVLLIMRSPAGRFTLSIST